MSEDIRVREQWQLLHHLRSTVEGLLNNGLSNVWNVYGGLNRLHNVISQIFKHGCRIFDPTGEPDCWIFIQGLNWLQPSLATSPIIRECDDYFVNLPPAITSRKDMLWLYTSLENHSLSQKLSWLLSDKEHLLSCLEPWAFLCQETLAEATLICLRAVEKNQPALLTDIDPYLFLPNWKCGKSPKKFHRRSSSYPVNLRSSKQEFTIKKPEHVCENCTLPSTLYNSVDLKKSVPIKEVVSTTESSKGRLKCQSLLRTWHSFPELNKRYGTLEGRSTSIETVTFIKKPGKKLSAQSRKVELASVIKIDYSEAKDAIVSTAQKMPKQKAFSRKGRSKARISQNPHISKKYSSGSSDTLNYEDSIKNIGNERLDFGQYSSMESSVTDSVKIEAQNSIKRKPSFLAGSAPEFMAPWSLKVEGQKDIRTPKKSFMEDGGSSVQPMATGYFPRPFEGQSIISFLSSAQFSRANAELDRENAHFSISEAMISAIEQVKCNRQLNLFEETVDESDEEINNLKQRIRFRRRQRQEEKRKGGVWIRDLLSDGKTDTTTTDQSVSPLSTSSESPSENSIDDLFPSSELYESNVSLYSEADLFKSSPRHGTESNLTDSIISAEGVALSLISRFSEKQLPRASELKWLVSEQDAPQELLPLPKNWSMDLDKLEVNQSIDSSISLRGTVEWAPPRAQIIFTPHPPPIRKDLLKKQKYRCAGCGMKVAVEYANRFRYCEYLGRYFCTGCHTNQVTVIPGKILLKWDFYRYAVSNFSYRLLDQMTMDPLFQVNDLNPSLYRRVKQLERTRILRTKLFFFRDFLFNCRFASSLQESLKKESQHLINDPHVYSIHDFIQVKLGILPTELQKLTEDCSAHVSDCMLCQARGFICEICYCKEAIYPWELSKVTRCDVCGACFHICCKDNSVLRDCPRCVRIHARHLSKDESL